jgi:glutamate-1-semialdehyde 2,1-aminomutase
MKQVTRSRRAFAEARKVLAGGVNSPVRAFKAVGGTPLFIRSARGARVTDIDGNTYNDSVGSWGPLIAGHAPGPVVDALVAAAKRGTSYGAPTELETALAREVCRAFPSIERVRFVNSGTEAAMSAARLARGVTRRDRIVKFDGGYHGHADSMLVRAGSGAMTFGVPTSPGVPAALAELTFNLPYNDLDAVRALCAKHGDAIAAVFVEPVAGNMGVVPPAPGFLEGLREVTRQHGILLVFDEVITGFRVAYGGAQARFKVKPDLTVFGKIIGGGLPVGAYGGPERVMSQLAPDGPVYQAGTLSGNPLAMSAGLAMLAILRKPGVYAGLERKADALARGLLGAAKAAGVPVTLNRVGSMMTLFFTDRPVTDCASSTTSDTDRYARYFRGMLDRGVYLPPAQFEAFFVSAAHAFADIGRTVRAAHEVLAGVARA